MAHAFSDPNEIRNVAITPAEALLEELGRTVHGVRWLDEKVASAAKDSDLLDPEGEMPRFLAMRERERAHLVRVAMAAENSKAAEFVRQRTEVHAAFLRSLVHGALEDVMREVVEGSLSLDAGLQVRASEILDGRILALEGVAQETHEYVDNQQVPY